MQEIIQKRIVELKAEFESGQKLLTELDAKRGDVTQTLLRISGAIQALEELSTELDKVNE